MVRVADRPVLDSDVLIDHLRGSGPGAKLIERIGPDLAYTITAVTAFELSLGRSYARDPTPVNALLGVPVLALDRAAGLRAGALLRDLRATGEPIDVRDAMQAGICLEAGAPLVTGNVSHFGRVTDLVVLSPSEAS